MRWIHNGDTIYAVDFNEETVKQHKVADVMATDKEHIVWFNDQHTRSCRIDNKLGYGTDGNVVYFLRSSIDGYINDKVDSLSRTIEKYRNMQNMLDKLRYND